MLSRKTSLRQYRRPSSAHNLRVDHCVFVQQGWFAMCANLQYVQIFKAPFPPKHSCFDCSVLQVVLSRQLLQLRYLGLVLRILLRIRVWCKAPACVISVQTCELVKCYLQACVHHYIHACPNAADFRSANCGCRSQSFHESRDQQSSHYISLAPT